MSGSDLRTQWSVAAGKLMRRIEEIGYENALGEEIDSPGVPDDPHWCRMIVALMAGNMADLHPFDEDSPTYSCPTCRDRRVILDMASSAISLECTECPSLPSINRPRIPGAGSWRLDGGRLRFRDFGGRRTFWLDRDGQLDVAWWSGRIDRYGADPMLRMRWDELAAGAKVVKPHGEDWWLI